MIPRVLIYCILLKETDTDLYVKYDGEKHGIWVSKTIASYDPKSSKLDVEEWWALDKGFGL